MNCVMLFLEMKITGENAKNRSTMNFDKIHTRVWREKEFCQDCEYYRIWLESEPWGSTEATRELCECTVDNIEECRGVIDRVEFGE